MNTPQALAGTGERTLSTREKGSNSQTTDTSGSGTSDGIDRFSIEIEGRARIRARGTARCAGSESFGRYQTVMGERDCSQEEREKSGGGSRGEELHGYLVSFEGGE